MGPIEDEVEEVPRSRRIARTSAHTPTPQIAEVDSATNRVRTTSTQAGATVRRTITGRGLALVMPRSKVRGKVTVTIDGKLAATVDTKYGSTQARRVVWWTRWTTSATHTVVVRVSGTSGRPTVSLDGLLVTK